MKTLNNPHLTFAAILLFIALAYSSYKPEQGYSEGDIKAMDALASHSLGKQSKDDWTPEQMKPEIAAQLVYLYGEK